MADTDKVSPAETAKDANGGAESAPRKGGKLKRRESQRFMPQVF